MSTPLSGTAIGILLSCSVLGAVFAQDPDPRPAPPHRETPRVKHISPEGIEPPEEWASPEQAAEVVRRSQAGDRQAMKWVITEHLIRVMELVDAVKFWGVPEQADQVALMMEVLAERQGDEYEAHVRGFGMSWLAKTGDPRGGEFLSRWALDAHKKEDSRADAICSIRFMPEFARPLLTKLADDPDPQIRIDVQFAAGFVMEPWAEALLKRLCDDPDRSVRASARGRLKCWQRDWAQIVNKDGHATVPAGAPERSGTPAAGPTQPQHDAAPAVRPVRSAPAPQPTVPAPRAAPNADAPGDVSPFRLAIPAALGGLALAAILMALLRVRRLLRPVTQPSRPRPTK